MMARLTTLTFLVVFSSFILIASNSAILDYFSSRESSKDDVEDELVPEVYGGALTDFFQTLTVVGEGEKSEYDLQREDDVENIPEVDIDIDEFLLVTDHELKARSRSDIKEAATSSAVELDLKPSDNEDLLLSESTSSMNFKVQLPVLQESRESSSASTTISTTTEPPIPTNTTEINELASNSDNSTSAGVSNLQSNSTFSNQQTVSTISTHSSSFESSLEVNDDVATPSGRTFLPDSEKDPVTASDKLLLQQPLEIDSEFSNLALVSFASPTTTVLSSLSSPSVDNITTAHSGEVDDDTTSVDNLLLALEKLDTLNEAVKDLHTSRDQSSQTDSNDHTGGVHDFEMQDEAQDRTDVIEDNDEDDSDGFFAFLYKWLA